LSEPAKNARTLDRRGNWLAAGVAFVGALSIYTWGANPSIGDRDTAEMQLVGLLGGIPHSPGYPLFVMISRVFSLLPTADPALRITLQSGFFGAVALASLVGVAIEMGLTAPWALAAAMMFGATFTFWAGAMRAEIYALGMSVLSLAMCATLAARRRRQFGLTLGAGAMLGLVLTAMLSAAPVVAIAGLALAWSVLREGRSVPIRLAALAGSFLVGLSPYLVLVWLDVHGSAYSYLRLVEQAQFTGWSRLPADFATPLRRVLWLVTARNEYPPVPLHVEPLRVARSAMFGFVNACLFELGPLLAALVPAGLLRAWRTRPGWGGLLTLAILASIAFSVITESGAMVPIFLLSGTLLMVLVAAYGAEGLVSRWLPSLARSWWGPPAIAALIMFLPHAIRVYSYGHPIGSHHWTVLDEDSSRPLRLFTKFEDPFANRRFAEGVLRAAPPHALLVAEWRELTPLRFVQQVEHMRPDVTIRPAAMPRLLSALRVHEDAHDLAHEPIVFVTVTPEMRGYLRDPDSLEAVPGRWIHIVRTPIPGLPAPQQQGAP
jgi:hypothetical protein